MARPLSSDKRNTLIQAAIQTIATQGLSATTALIAKNAGVATGSLFTYFDSKEVLFNATYLEIKRHIAQAMMPNFPRTEFASQLLHLWNHYIDWGIEHREARQTLQQLEVSTILTEETRQEAKQIFLSMQQMFNAAEAMVEATIQQILQEPTKRDIYKTLGFTMMWKAISHH